jgi:uncharacterized protein (DUF58 family)
LPVDQMARLDRLRLRSRRPIIGMVAGGHRAVRRGASLDFADHRRYADGDDVRHVDYNVLARLDQLVVRQFDAEEELTLRLFIDASASMTVGEKYETAAALAAALGFLALRDRDTVSVHTLLDPQPTKFVGPGALPTLLRHLHELGTGSHPARTTQSADIGSRSSESQAASRLTPLDEALSALAYRQGPPGYTVVLSDLYAAEWEQAIRRLPHPRRDTLVVQVLHPDELHPDLSGDLDLIDVETSERRAVSLDAKALRDHATHMLEWTESVRALCTSLALNYRLLLVGDDVTGLIADALESSAR